MKDSLVKGNLVVLIIGLDQICQWANQWQFWYHNRLTVHSWKREDFLTDVFKLLKPFYDQEWKAFLHAFFCNKQRARSIQPKFPEISVQNSMDLFCPTGKVSKKRVHLLRWTPFPGWTGWNFCWMDRAKRASLLIAPKKPQNPPKYFVIKREFFVLYFLVWDWLVFQ